MRRIAMIAILLGAALMARAETGSSAVPATEAPASDDVIDIVFVQAKKPFYLRVHARRGGESCHVAWQSYVSTLFASLDKDGTGDLSEEEFYLGPWSRLRRGGLTKPSDLSFLDVDTNPRDEFVTQAELTEALKRFATMAQFNGNPVRSRATDALFTALDRDGNEKLDAGETTDAFAKLHRFDRNDDEAFTPNDLQPALSEMQVNSFVVDRGSRRNQKPREVLLARAPEEDDQRLARRIFRHYDRAGNRRLREEDISLGEGVFAQTDANADQLLDVEEFSKWFAAHGPDLEVIVDLESDEQTGLRLVANPAGEASSVRLDSAGALVIAIEHDELAVSVAAPREDSGKKQADAMAEQLEQQFKSIDRDNNGYLDRDEIRDLGAMEALAAMDRDQDRKIFLDEVQSYVELQRAITHHQTQLQVADQGSTLFDVIDNKDMRLSQRELRKLGELVARWDTNGDGALAIDEIPRRFQMQIRPGVVENSLGTLTLSLPVALDIGQLSVTNTVGPKWFQRLDRNGDGDLSPREFLGPIEMFRQLDTDADGLISVAEAEAAK